MKSAFSVQYLVGFLDRHYAPPHARLRLAKGVTFVLGRIELLVLDGRKILQRPFLEGVEGLRTDNHQTHLVGLCWDWNWATHNDKTKDRQTDRQTDTDTHE